MVKVSFSCSMCKQTFSRKFNADRHNNQVHDGIAVIFNKETGWISDKRDLITSSSNTSDISEIKKPTSKLEKFKESTTNSISDPNRDNLKNFYKKRLELETDNDKDDENEQIVLKMIGKLSPYIDTFDSLLLLSRGMGAQERNQILAELIIYSLAHSNPFAFIKEQIEFYRSVIAMRRAISLTSQYYNIQPARARETLKALVLNSPYVEKRFKVRK